MVGPPGRGASAMRLGHIDTMSRWFCVYPFNDFLFMNERVRTSVFAFFFGLLLFVLVVLPGFVHAF